VSVSARRIGAEALPLLLLLVPQHTWSPAKARVWVELHGQLDEGLRRAALEVLLVLAARPYVVGAMASERHGSWSREWDLLGTPEAASAALRGASGHVDIQVSIDVDVGRARAHMAARAVADAKAVHRELLRLRLPIAVCTDIMARALVLARPAAP
jgi:hypothetical protein